tara:strand:+ start:78 stop:257 length:180 start_codon:yes stop_codon:yes gene_type:complete
MQKIGYSIKLWHAQNNKYEDLGMEIEAVTRKEAIQIFKNKSGWVVKDGTTLVAIPPVCR